MIVAFDAINKVFHRAPLATPTNQCPEASYKVYRFPEWTSIKAMIVFICPRTIADWRRTCCYQDVRWHDARDLEFATVDVKLCWGLIVNSHGNNQWLNAVSDSRHWHGLKRFCDIGERRSDFCSGCLLGLSRGACDFASQFVWRLGTWTIQFAIKNSL